MILSESALPILRTVSVFLFLLTNADTHPASGIVVDDAGNIFVIDSRRALYRVDTHRATTTVKTIKDGHWLALDHLGGFANANPKYFERVTPAGVIPALIYAGGGAPITVARDGQLYYGSGESNGDPMFPGALEMSRLRPDGTQSKVSDQLRRILSSWDDGITALAAGQDESVYVGTWTGLLKVRFDGTAEVIQHPVVVPECDVDYADHKPGNKLPFIRGIAVRLDNTIFAAATSCHAVIKLSRSGRIETVLKSERPWSPTGIALDGNNIYVLEYTNANGPGTEGWKPRIRMIDAQGQVNLVATFK